MKTLLYSVKEYQYLADQIVEQYNIEKGQLEVKTFPDGERYLRILDDVDDANVIIVAGTFSDASLLTLFDLACAASKYGARRIQMIVPYFGYSTMERAEKSGEVVTAKTRARILSSIPSASRGNQMYLLDLHSDGIPHYFEDSLTVFHLHAEESIKKVLAEYFPEKDYILASTDAGRAKWVQSLANQIGVEPAFIYKKRLDGSNTEVLAMNANVKGRKVVIYDDMIRTGGSLVEAAKAYKKGGATEISAISTHGILPGDSLNKILSSDLFFNLFLSDSHPRVKELSHERLKVFSIADCFAPAFHRS